VKRIWQEKLAGKTVAENKLAGNKLAAIYWQQ